MYTPIRANPGNSTSRKISFPSKSGENLRSLPQLLDTKYALRAINYLIEDEGRLKKRKGISQLFSVGGTSPITMLEKYTDDIYIFGYGTTVARYTISTDTITNIKTDFSANNGFVGERYGDYFFVCNGVDKIWRMDSAFAISEVSASPICSTIKVIGNRLFAGNLSTDSTAVQYSAIDDGTNPPFNTWSVDSATTAGGKAYYRKAGQVNSINALGDNIIVFGEDGKWAFTIDQLDSGGTISKVETFHMVRGDMGGATGAIETDKGVFYVNNAGLWQLISVGQPDVPYSDQEILTSIPLGTTYFKNLTLDDADITYLPFENLILVTCKSDSNANNAIVAYNLDNKAFTSFSQWTIEVFMVDGQSIYGGSSINGKVWQLFDGYDDDGLAIGTEYVQELTLGAPFTRKFLEKFYCQGFLSASTEITIHFDIYDRDGKYIRDKIDPYTWTPQLNNNTGKGYGEESYGTGSYGGDKDFANTVESFDGCNPFIRNLQRLQIRFTSGDKLPHEINWFSVQAKEKAMIRKRKLTQS